MMAPAVCLTWNDHNWKEPRFLEAGKHPTMGTFHKYVTECTLCGKQTTETHWISLSAAALKDIGETPERKEQ